MANIEVLAHGCAIELPSGAKQTYPVGWSGDVDDVVAATWCGDGRARYVAGTVAGLNEAQTAVLAAVADNILFEQHITQLQAALAEMSDAEIRDLAKQSGMKVTKKTTRDAMIAAIIAAETGVEADADSVAADDAAPVATEVIAADPGEAA